MQADVLWQRINAFELDAPDCGLTFSERAARENGWTLGFTARVIEEYKRFLFLAVTCKHMVCPSDAVDQIWHMHLTYTHSYWDNLCGDLLGRSLHHGPTRGGSDEHVKYFQLYERTVQSYRASFGHPPPEDIWPPARQRFGEDLEFVRVNLHRHWIIPKPKPSRKLAGTASAVLLFPLAQLAANPLDWPGPQFLMLYLSLIAIAVLLSWLGRWWLLNSEGNDPFQPDHSRASDQQPISPIEAGWMDGGASRAVDCALVELIQKEAISIEGKLIVAGKNAERARADHRVSDLILNSVATSSVGRKYDVVCREANVGLESLRQRLIAQGLVLDRSQRAAAAALPVALLGGVLALGVAKALIGAARDKPIVFLLIAMFVAVATLVVFLVSVPKLTKSGQRVLHKLKAQATSEPQGLPPAGAENLPAVSDNTLLWSTALLGTAALASTPWSELDTFLTGQRTWNSSSSGGCSTSGCGGDSGGGCGGGGCGGCGGD